MVNLNFKVAIDPAKYPNLTQKLIREIIRNFDFDGAMNDYIHDMIKSELSNRDYESK